MSAESICRYRAEFARLEPQLSGADLLWLHHARCVALERFAEFGFPTTAQEDWKYTNVAPIERHAFKSAPQAPDGVDQRQVEELALGADYLLVFINGRYAPGLSRLASLPQGATVASLAAALVSHADYLEASLTGAAEAASDGFAALNAALWMDGAYIDLAPGVVIEPAIQLLFISTETDLAVHLRNIVRAGAGARATIVEHYVGTNGAAYFTNAATRIAAGSGAVVEHYKLQQESPRAFHIASIEAQQEQDSRFASHSFALGALLSRNYIGIRLDAEGCHAALNGLYMVGGRQHVDHHTRIDHLKPRGTSREYFKGVVDGAARAVFNGKVIVHPDAQKSDAHQSNRNLLLSENAEVDTKPQLEIYADDVKCAHGATVGQLDENQIFYLQSRGLDSAAATILLTYAFASEIIGRVGVAPIKDRLEELLVNRLPGGHLVRELS